MIQKPEKIKLITSSQSTLMKVFWDKMFLNTGSGWGIEAAESALLASDLFLKNGIQNVLIPGIGYGRNATPFIKKSMNVTGIEISSTAIEMARRQLKLDIDIHQGSVTDMPFDHKKYQGIYCYSLLHLLNLRERRTFLDKCYNQLSDRGLMYFIVISARSELYGTGKKISADRFQIENGLKVYFYSIASAERQFRKYSPVEIFEHVEPIRHMPDEPGLKCITVICRKP